MAKIKSVWYCKECGHKQLKWTGQCFACHKWDTLNEEMELPESQRRYTKLETNNKPIRISEVTEENIPRFQTGLTEWDRLLGGGLVPGSLSLVGGNPGIGKSTLLLQVAASLAEQGLTILYVSGEESVQQTSLRAKRLGAVSNQLLLLSETNIAAIKNQIDEVKPDLVIVDSIQIIYKGEVPSAPGSVTQVRECTTELMHLAKQQKIAVILVGHVTKSGEIAGPKVLEHLVDTVLYFEGDRDQHFRMIRVVKNRFGATDEVAVFNMTSKGLQEVLNPSMLFLEERKRDLIGSSIIPTVEGSRPILVEVQALVTKTAYATPTRRAAGLDSNRLALLLAVLEKRLRFPLYSCDVFVSIAGGFRILEPAIDLGTLAAVASSFQNRLIDPDMVVVGEVGLGGEVRSVPRIEQRLKEAHQMGFKRAIIPKHSSRGLTTQIQLIPVEYVDEAISALST